MTGAVLALDLGGKTGYALRHGENTVSGRWNVGPPARKKGEPKEPWRDRFQRFRDKLLEVQNSTGLLSAIVYERVEHHNGVAAAHCYAGYRLTLLNYAAQFSVPVYDFTSTQWKSLATGTGGGRKAGSLATVRALGYEPIDDNESDAICLLIAWHTRYGSKD